MIDLVCTISCRVDGVGPVAAGDKITVQGAVADRLIKSGKFKQVVDIVDNSKRTNKKRGKK